MIKSFIQYIKESDDSSKFTEVKEELKSMIDNTIENSGGEFNTFIESFKKNPEDFKIEGLINDSDIYDFYLKWRNDIDEILNDVNFFDEIPSDSNAFGLYEFTIKGTERAIKELVQQF